MIIIFFISPVAQNLFDGDDKNLFDVDKRSAMSVDMMTSFKQDFAQKFSLNNSQQQQQQQSGEKTPSELSVSIAGKNSIIKLVI